MEKTPKMWTFPQAGASSTPVPARMVRLFYSLSCFHSLIFFLEQTFLPYTTLTFPQKSPSTSVPTAPAAALGSNSVASKLMQSASVLVLLLVAIPSRSVLALEAAQMVVIFIFIGFLVPSTTHLAPYIDNRSIAIAHFYPEATVSALDHRFRPIKADAAKLVKEMGHPPSGNAPRGSKSSQSSLYLFPSLYSIQLIHRQNHPPLS